MNKFNDYDNAKKEAQNQGTAKLPAGAYVCKIEAVKYETTDNGDRIALRFDIAEGEQKEFFKKQYEANTNEDRKWKGRINVFIPRDDGSEKDKITKRAFASWTDSFEKSNNGYVWDWDENKWKGKIVGIVFGETGTNIDGRDIVYTEPRFPIEVEKVRNGSAPQAKFKAKDGYKSGSSANVDANGFMTIPESENDEVPF